MCKLEYILIMTDTTAMKKLMKFVKLHVLQFSSLANHTQVSRGGEGREEGRGEQERWRRRDGVYRRKLNFNLGKTSLAAKLASTLGLVHLEVSALLASESYKDSEISREVTLSSPSPTHSLHSPPLPLLLIFIL
jgi:hypothetical protein